MTHADFHPDPALQRDLLISRVVDGRAASEDWAALDQLAETDAAVWRDLAQAQRDHALLTGAVLAEVSTADHVAIAAHESPSYKLSARLRTAAVWGGWAAAAAVALAWMGGLPARQDSGARGVEAGLGAPIIQNASDALAAYLDKGKQEGRVIEQLPGKVLIEDPRLTADGQGYEVIYLRQIVERERVPDLYRFSRDETGGLTPVRIQIRATPVPGAGRTTGPM